MSKSHTSPRERLLYIPLNLYQLSRLKEERGKVAYNIGRTGILSVSAAAMLALSQQAAAAQTPSGDVPAATVSWTVPAQTVKKTGALTLTLHGQAVPGWHVYGLRQLPDGPTPLLVTVAANPVAKAAGAPTGSAPTRYLDPDFGLETQFYNGAFTISLPVRMSPRAAAGAQAIPVDVRFQTCNGRICEPPKTVRLLAPVTLQAG
jgi:hypothetical protein